MKFLSYSIIVFMSFFLSCTSPVQQEDIVKLNGYWEIDLVTTKDDSKKAYKINPTVDFFKVAVDGNGFRKKMMANFTGAYSANNRKDTVQVVVEDGAYILKTKTPFHTWQERILKLNDKQLILENDKGTVFQYKRHQKIDLDE